VYLIAQACSSPRTASAHAGALQESGGLSFPVDLGLEVRVYPAGLIPVLYGEAPLTPEDTLTFGLGANWTDRGDDGEQDDEEGWGYGGGVGYRRALGPSDRHWFLGVRVDLWKLEIDWKDDNRDGTTDVLVLQPTAEGGYTFPLGPNWRGNLFAAIGAEINVDTDGEDVGEGAIALLGVSWVYGSGR